MLAQMFLNAFATTFASATVGALGALLTAAVLVVAGLLMWMRRLRESERRFRFLFQRSPDATVLFDTRTGVFTDCNEAALRLLRADREWILGKHPWDVAPEFQPDGKPSREKAVELIETINRAGSARFEWQHRRGDRTDFPAEISITTLEISAQPMWLAVIRDVTEWKRAQSAVEQANQTLERRVAERTAELNRAEQELRRALEAERELSDLKSNFVSMVSHEFRTPLGVINMSAQILDRYYARLTDERRRENVDAITKAVRRMTTMMENVLVLSRVDRSQLGFAPKTLELVPFCRLLIDEMHSATAAATPIEFSCTDDVPAEGVADESLLRHILTNLISNAVKYSPPDQAARLTLRREGDFAVFTVEDRGIGIPEADRGHLFEAFHRGSNVGQIVGTGLGLVIVKRCCDLHGGSISFTSERASGTLFTVRIPAFPQP
jgi:PAS domain S-box-containing protein